jgi:peptide deformylase
MIDVDKCTITRYPAAVLGQPAAPVEKIDETIRRLVEKMTDIMIEKQGLGWRRRRRASVCGCSSSPWTLARAGPGIRQPHGHEPAGDLDENGEAASSVPGIYPKIRRYKRATVTATDLDGHEFTEEADGLYARCLQHESDHLDGMTILNRMGAAAKIANRRQIKKLIDNHEGK